MRKVLIIIVCSFLTAAFAQSQEPVRWYSINEAVELNKKEPRLFMIDVYTDWCGWCKRMDANTFTNPVIADYVNTYFYPVKLNAEQKDDIILEGKTYSYVENGSRGYNELAAILLNGRLSYPSIVYLNEKLQIISIAPGYKTPPQLEIYLAFFQQRAYTRQNITEFAETFRGKIAPEPSSATGY